MYRQGLTPIDGYQYSVGVARIAIPTDLDRETYIADCYRNYQVLLHHEDGSFSVRVPIDPDILNYIEFPIKPSELGSAVVFVTEPMRNKPIIVAKLGDPKSIGDLKENQFKIRRQLNGSYVEIVGSAQDNSLSITVDGQSNASAVYVNIFNENNNGSLNISVAGDTTLQSTGDLVLEQFNSATIKVIDEDADNEETNLVIDKKGIKIQSNKLVVNKGTENFILGQKFKSFMNDFITEISQATVTTAIGQQPLLNATKIAAYRNQLDSLLSEIMYIDK